MLLGNRLVRVSGKISVSESKNSVNKQYANQYIVVL